MGIRVEYKVLRSIGQHPLTVSETKDRALSTFNKEIKECEKLVANNPYNYTINKNVDIVGGPLPVHTIYHGGVPNNRAYWVVRVYEG